MMDEQLDMARFCELMTEEDGDNRILVALKKLMEIEEPESIEEALGERRLGVWSGWQM